jgi:Flp pilus assembly protein TadG
MAILMLMMDAAWAIFAQATLQEAAREGVRYAVTGQTGTGMCQDASIRSIVQQYAYGFISPSNAASQITIQYFLPTTLAPVSGVGSNAGGNIVQISISGVQVRSFGPIWRSNSPVNVAASAADVMEAPPNNIPPCR